MSNIQTGPLPLQNSSISTVATDKAKVIFSNDISQSGDAMAAVRQDSLSPIAVQSGHPDSAVEIDPPSSLPAIASDAPGPHHSRNTMSVSLVNTARAESTPTMAQPTTLPFVEKYKAIPALTPRVLTVPTTASHRQRKPAEDFQFINEDDPFAAIITSSPQSELLIITPDSGATAITLEQGTRLTTLAANGEWFHARTESGMAGYIKIRDVEIEVTQYTPIARDRSIP